MSTSNLSVSETARVVRFPHSKNDLRRISVEDSEGLYDVYRLEPRALDWPASEIPDDVNPRSHDEECLKGTLARDIEKTLREEPENFWLANRGGFLLAEKVKFDPEKSIVTLFITDTDIHGMADGATTNAIIKKLQDELKQKEDPDLRESLELARFNLDVVVGINDRERIAKLVQGRNRSRVVKEWSLADFKGDFDWIKKIIDREHGPFKDRIGWEENSGKSVSVLDLTSLMMLFHPIFDDPKEKRRKAPTVAYSSKGINDRRLIDPKMSKGFRQLETVLEDIVKLHDYVYSNFVSTYERYNKQVHNTGSKLGRRRGIENKETTLPLTGTIAEKKIDKGLLFPLLASLRALLKFKNGKATWVMDPFKFFDNRGPDLMSTLIDQYELCDKNPQTTGKKKANYTALHNEARLILGEELQKVDN